MITFPNAKINIGLRITERRPDGYHNLETLFVPIGLYAGTPENPVSFCDTLEVARSDRDSYIFTGNTIDCPLEKNLVYKAVELFRKESGLSHPVSVYLEKHLPDGAGLGGGSADASFTLKMLNELNGLIFDDEELERIALKLGADCPLFIRNRICYGEGIGEKLTPVDLSLDGWWIVIVKPDIYVSTREAFSGIKPKKDPDGLPFCRLGEIPVSDWRDLAVNDFEKSIFPIYPELAEIKQSLYRHGASYASMSGSGSSLFGLFSSYEAAASAAENFSSPLHTYVLKL